MEYRRLGRTGLQVSVLSLGTGGPNRLGQSRYVSSRTIDRLIGRALELGINLFDTSGAYEDSEVRLARALRGTPRDRYFLASKIFPWRGGRLLGAVEIRQSVERSLRRLRVDELEMLQLHRVSPETYEMTRDRILPELERLRAAGKFRFLGITESSSRDPSHRMLECALRDDLFDTVMVAYNPVNRTAERTIFTRAQQLDTGVICMTAARRVVPRNAAARLGVLARTLVALAAKPPADLDRLRARLRTAAYDFMRAVRYPAARAHGIGNERSLRLPEDAYAFALNPPQVASVLTGTTNPEHLERNVMAVEASALSGDAEAIPETRR